MFCFVLFKIVYPDIRILTFGKPEFGRKTKMSKGKMPKIKKEKCRKIKMSKD